MFKARRWLDEEEFKELLKIADYREYIRGEGAVFVFNIEKAVRNNYDYTDIVNIIQELGLELESGSLDELREMFSEYTVSISWDYNTGYVIIDVPKKVSRKIYPILRKYNARRYYGVYSPDKISYKIIPYRLHEFLDEIKKQGIQEVNDRDGLLKPKKLPMELELRDIVLRDYQEEALKKWLENNGRGIVALPTGSGKTIIGVAAIAATGLRTLIITFTREQMFQWKETIYKYTNIEPGYVGLIYSDEKRLAPITITTYQSGYRNINKLSPLFDLLIVDEVHHLPADKFRYIAIHSIAAKRMGLSATVVREDGKHVELFPLLGGIIYHKTAAELAQKGYLARYRIITVKVKLQKDEREEYEDLRRLYRRLAGYRPFKEVLEAALKGDERARQALKIHNKMRSITSRSVSKIEKAVEIARKELSKGSKIIIFTQYVEQAKEIARRLNAHLLTGEVPSEKRKMTLREFKESPSGVLVVTTVGDEGLDIPDANVGIIVSGTGSRRQFIQRLGRILRPKKDGREAKLYEIILVNTPEEYLSRKRKKQDLGDFMEPT